MTRKMKNLTVEGMTADWRTMTIMKTTFLNESRLDCVLTIDTN